MQVKTAAYTDALKILKSPEALGALGGGALGAVTGNDTEASIPANVLAGAAAGALGGNLLRRMPSAPKKIELNAPAELLGGGAEQAFDMIEAANRSRTIPPADKFNLTGAVDKIIY